MDVIAIEEDSARKTASKKCWRQLEPFEEEEGAYRAYPLFPYNLRTKFESYLVNLDPGCEHASEPHNEGVEEYIYVHRGGGAWSWGSGMKFIGCQREAPRITPRIGCIGTGIRGRKRRVLNCDLLRRCSG